MLFKEGNQAETWCFLEFTISPVYVCERENNTQIYIKNIVL